MQLSEYCESSDENASSPQGGEPAFLHNSPHDLSTPSDTMSVDSTNDDYDPLKLIAELLRYREYLEEVGRLIPATPIRIEEFEQSNACMTLYYDTNSNQYYEQVTPTQIPDLSPTFDNHSYTTESSLSPGMTVSTDGYEDTKPGTNDPSKIIVASPRLFGLLEDLVENAKQLETVVHTTRVSHAKKDTESANHATFHFDICLLLAKMGEAIVQAHCEMKETEVPSEDGMEAENTDARTHEGVYEDSTRTLEGAKLEFIF